VSTGELPFPVWKEKLQWAPIFLSNPESSDSWRESEGTEPGPAETATASNTKLN
jgi:hypothetical protein